MFVLMEQLIECKGDQVYSMYDRIIKLLFMNH